MDVSKNALLAPTVGFILSACSSPDRKIISYLIQPDIFDTFTDIQSVTCHVFSRINPFPGLLDDEMKSSISVSTHDYTALLKRLRESESRAQTAEARLAAAAEDLSKMKLFAEDFVMNQTEEKEDAKVE